MLKPLFFVFAAAMLLSARANATAPTATAAQYSQLGVAEAGNGLYRLMLNTTVPGTNTSGAAITCNAFWFDPGTDTNANPRFALVTAAVLSGRSLTFNVDSNTTFSSLGWCHAIEAYMMM
jgi:hypothetical protein